MIGPAPVRADQITIKSAEEIQIMREAGKIVGEVLQVLAAAAKPGVATIELDEIVRREYEKRGAIATFVGYPPGSKNPFRHTVCISVNSELVHGVPGEKVLREGDIVSLDLGATYKGFVGDSAITVGVGEITPEKQRLIEVTKESLWRGIRAAKAGVHLGVVSNAIGEYIEGEGYGVVREYGGHGIGRRMHEEPHIGNYATDENGRQLKPERGPVLRKGMALAIEPMVTIGDWRTKTHKDGWTVSPRDDSLCAHFEHTIAITDDEPIVLTLP